MTPRDTVQIVCERVHIVFLGRFLYDLQHLQEALLESVAAGSSDSLTAAAAPVSGGSLSPEVADARSECRQAQRVIHAFCCRLDVHV